MKHLTKYIFIFMCTILLVNCGGDNSFKRPEMSEQETKIAQSVIGNWIEFNPFNEEKPKSFELKENGEATSHNLINKNYKYWWISNHELAILSKNKETTDTLRFSLKATSENTIVLEQNNLEYTYKKVKE